MKQFLLPILATGALIFPLSAADESAAPWWNTAWTQRQSLAVDGSAVGAGEATGPVTVLLRLSDANFPFASAREDGSDIRIVAADGKTVLPHQIESYDNLLNEAFIWVKLPDLKAAKETLHVYSANADAAMPAGPKATDAYDENTVLAYHFAGRGAAPTDATANNNTAGNPGATAEGGLIGNGLRLTGANVTVPNSASLEWKAGQNITIGFWGKAAALQDKAVLFSRGDFSILLDQGKPLVKLAGKTSAPGTVAPLAPGIWNHLALVADGKTLKLFLNGETYSTLDGALSASTDALALGAVDSGFGGEIDELVISNNARPASWIKASAITQGSSDTAQRAISLGQVEGGGAGEQSHLMEHLSLFGDIANNMMFDGWIAIGVCAIMIVVGWTVAVKKFLYLNSIEKGTKVFLGQWKNLSTDLTALDPGDEASVSTLGGQVDASQQALVAKSPLFHIYQIGSDEIRHRLDKDGTLEQGLNGRSIQAIRASLDAGLVHESHRLSDGLVYLTISIAGGPYVGLLGTVVGVMITFAIIAKSGEVNVNSIAPGIASALLATVVGLVVAIPALFIYSYLNGRIKNSLGLMQVFIDEFVAKMAEFYRPAAESDYTGGESTKS